MDGEKFMQKLNYVWKIGVGLAIVLAFGVPFFIGFAQEKVDKKTMNDGQTSQSRKEASHSGNSEKRSRRNFC